MQTTQNKSNPRVAIWASRRGGHWRLSISVAQRSLCPPSILWFDQLHPPQRQVPRSTANTKIYLPWLSLQRQAIATMVSTWRLCRSRSVRWLLRMTRIIRAPRRPQSCTHLPSYRALLNKLIRIFFSSIVNTILAPYSNRTIWKMLNTETSPS